MATPLAGWRMLAVVAHPDDEAWALGGILAGCAEYGAEVHVAFASRGEGGVDLSMGGPAAEGFGAHRSAEARASCALIGAEPHFLDLPDGGLARVPPVQACTAVVELIERHRPHVVVTMGQDGGYGHEDHMAVTDWCVAAVQSLDPERQPRLLLRELPPRLLHPVWRRLRNAGFDGVRPRMTPESFGRPRREVDLVLDVTLWKTAKRKALEAHASQLPGGDIDAFLMPGLMARIADEEWFTCAVGPPLPPGAGTPFEGLERCIPPRPPRLRGEHRASPRRRGERGELLSSLSPSTVLHLARDLPPLVSGGMSIATGAIVDAQGTGAAVISFDDWRPRTKGVRPETRRERTAVGAEVLRVSSPSDLDTARRFAEEVAPSAVVVHDGLLWDLAVELKERLGVPLTLVVHVAHRALLAARGASEETASLAAQERALAEADRISVPTAAAAALLGPSFAADRRVKVEAPPPTLEPAPRRGGGPVLYVGRFGFEKGTQDLIAAWPAVRERHPAAGLRVVGGVPRSPRTDRRWRRRFEALEGVELVGWSDRAALASAYADASLVVIPSRIETYGLVAAEARAAGAPVLAADLPALREVFGDASVEWFPAGDVAALTSAIDGLLSGQDFASKMS